ncbi:hypothetical protein ACU18_15375 [Arthrobacter sp. ZBG10]|uniref:hypothetical protein n=1 Tax=Arthrobacter sp. ZBG10 TaxID=1676590 RepID=UPI000680D567|nr:hypothetical protein [Arthrobacter sp. ZBG10]KNH15984.1 hypothetical protein ACU18_15375 [Arthrobacter sp. ZBG10]
MDKKITGTSGFTLAGIDQDRWLVVGIDIGGGENGHAINVVAVDKDTVPQNTSNIFEYLINEYGHIPVTDFRLHDVDPYELLQSITHGFELKLRTRPTVGRRIMVTALGDIPAQD